MAWLQFAWVSATNFKGYDEWLMLSLLSRGIVSFPYANRPLAMVWSLPAAWLGPDPVVSHYVLHGTYLALTGVLTFLIVRRFAPENGYLAWLAGVFAATWAPRDYLRLDSVQMLPYSGFMSGVLLSLLLLGAAWSRRNGWLLAAAAGLALCTVRSYEGVLPLLVGAPLLLVCVLPVRPPWMWTLPWYGCLAIGVAQMLGWFSAGSGSLHYQSMIRPDLSVVPLASRMIQHYAFGLLPLVQTSWRELAVVAVVPVLIAFWAGLTWSVPRNDASFEAPRAHAWSVVIGLALAGLGWASFALSPVLTTPDRTQFLPAPGMGVALAGAAVWLASWLPGRWRRLGVAALGGWVLWVGTARVMAMQRQWDARTAFPVQSRLLRELTRLAPDLRTNTLVILLDQTGAWGAFAFRHAVEYLYDGRASGYLWGSRNFLYWIELTPAGVVYETGPAIRRPWRSPPSRHRFQEVVFVRYGADGTVAILDRWPDEIVPLPVSASYTPHARIVAGGPAPASRAALR